MSKGVLFDIVHGSFVDGPGVRTTVFFKGCHLRCKWCHNPESQSFEPEYLQRPHGRTLCGKTYTAEAVMAEIRKDRAFYADDGGVTFSGGECMCQIDFLSELLSLCRQNEIATAVDTAGDVPYERFERILPYTDLFLYDVKCFDDEQHRRLTGVSNRRILENLGRLLQAGKRVWVRIPVIGGVNDREDEMEGIFRFLSSHGGAERVELLPHHSLGENKYRALGKDPCVFSTPDDETMKRLYAIFEK